MRSLLEKAIVHLLNEEKDEARAAFHQFVVARARQIHESNRQGEDPALDKDWSNDLYVSEEDLVDEAEEKVEGEIDQDGEVEADIAGEEADEVEASEDEGDEDSEEGDDEGEDQGMEDAEAELEDDLALDDDSEDRLLDLQKQLDALTAEFEEMMKDEEGEADIDADEEVEAEDAEVSDEEELSADDIELVGAADAEANDDMKVDAEQAADAEVEDAEEVKEDKEFDDLSESLIAELETIVLDNDDGKTTGGKVDQNKMSPVGSRKVKADAAPIVRKSNDNKSFDREDGPAVSEPNKKYRVRKSAKDGMDEVKVK